MKLVTFNAENLPNQRTITPNIGVNSKSGTIRFNRTSVEKMSLKDGLQVQFHHDDDEPGDWYLEVVKKDGFLLRTKNNITGEGGLITQSCQLVRKIFDSMEYNGISGNILIGADYIQLDKKTLWPLITRKLASKN